MGLNHHFMILPLLSIFFVLHLQLSSATNDFNYQQWLRWNVQNHNHRRNRVTLEQQLGGVTTKVLDLRLENAEINPISLLISQDGSGDYTSIAQALNTIPPYNTRRFLLHIAPGLYREKIHIPKIKPFISFVGDVNNPPTITGNDTASIARGDGSTFNTFQTATVGVDADYFIALNIIFQNTAPHEVGRTGEQAVALRISGNKAAFYNCSFYGSQDTLYDHRGLHYFRNCFIQGSVDFIFGYGRSFYQVCFTHVYVFQWARTKHKSIYCVWPGQNCTLNSIAKKVASVTAQKRSPSSMSSGFSFKDCRVTGSGLVYLGRAWGDYSRVVFTFTFFDKLVLPQAWSNWGNPLRNLTVYYGEYKCSGPGSNMTGRVPWARALTDEEAQPFVGSHFVEGDSWLVSPST